MMGKVIVTAKLENLEDLHAVHLGVLSADQVRRIEVTDALVDTGAMGMMLPMRLVNQLGLRQWGTRNARTASGPIILPVYGTVQLTVQGREFRCDVYGVPDGTPVLIGQIPLEGLDFVVDPTNQRLIGNPEHGGEHMIDVF